MLCALSVGLSFILYLMKIKVQFYKRMIVERILVILFGLFIQLVPLIMEICNVTFNSTIV